MSDDVKQKEANEAESAPTGASTAPLRGIVGTKIGMTRVFTDDREMAPVTVVSSEGVIVTQVKTKDIDGYDAVQIGYGDVPEKKLSKAEGQHFMKKGIAPKRTLHEFQVSDPSRFHVGQPVPATVFVKGDWLQVSGLSKGKGFAGVIKRHGFSGLSHSHGNGEYRRHPGSSGAQGPQHVLPGKKKPGHMGHIWSTEPKIEVVDVDSDRNLILLKGSIPGPNGNIVVLRPTTRKVTAKPQTQAPTKAKSKK